jgi:hypothetical protein
MMILLGVYQLQMLLSINPDKGSAKKGIIFGVIVLHGLLFLGLKHFQGVPGVSFLTLAVSAAVFVFYYAGGFRFSRRLWIGTFAVLLIVQPVWMLRAYAFNAMEFKSILPSMHVNPAFSWVRPDKPAVSTARIYQFVHYEDFWYDMSMTDAPAQVGFPQSATRWTFDLSEHTPADVLARYARYKIILYDNLGAAPEPVSGPSPQLSVVRFDVNTLKVKTDFSVPRILVYNDSYTSSWKAYLDGTQVELLRVNGAFKGIRVPAGSHTAEFAYQPPGGAWVYITAGIAFFIFMIATVFMIYWSF